MQHAPTSQQSLFTGSFLAPIGATLAVRRTWLAFDETGTIRVGAVSQPVTIVVYAIRTLCFAARWRAAVIRAVALIFTCVCFADAVTANGWRTAVDLAVETVFAAFALAVAAT